MAGDIILVTGATGYVGGRLVPRLLEKGYKVRAIARSPGKLACRPWASHPLVELAKADALDAASLYRALKGCRAAYYLVHSMGAGSGDFADADRRAALNMAAAAGLAGLERVIYLGGLVPPDQELSKHLASRAQVARALAAGGVPVTWLRAAMILGSGSASFEILRYLAEHLPVMITPTWVRSLVQPIAIGDVLGYLTGCLEAPETLGQTLDIGGPQVLTYADMFQIYAQEAGLRRRVIIPVPFFSPKLSSYWIHLVTPVPAAIARPLAEGLRHSVVCGDERIRAMIPLELTPCRLAMRRALDRLAQARVETCWMDAGQAVPPEWLHCQDAAYAGGTILHTALKARLDAPPQKVWPGIAAIGGKNGWYGGDILWRARGWLDRLLGGVGHGRGRRDPGELWEGDALDLWRVLALEPGRRLTLLAEMKLPGQAVLELRLESVGDGQCELSLVARFLPRGLAGLAYWYAALPLHGLVFGRLIKNLARRQGAALLEGPRPFDPAPPACALPVKDGGRSRPA